MTKTLHFNISGNRLSKTEEPSIVIKDLGYAFDEITSEEEQLERDEYYYNHYTTLRDISVLLYGACGQGVGWNLSRELATELAINEKDAYTALMKIIRKYAEMTEEEAMKKYNELATYIEDGRYKKYNED